MLTQCLLYGSWLVFPFIAWMTWWLRQPHLRWLAMSMLAIALVFTWSRFIETRIIRVQDTTLAGIGADLDIALVSDIHLGVYKGRAFLDRVVDRINALPVQAVAIAGDLTYEPQGQSLEDLFAPLARLEVPVYAVLGNHDQQAPGPDIDAALRAALRTHGVQIIEGEIATFDGIRLAGLGDRWARKDDPAFLRASPSPLPTLVLAHNPDSATDLLRSDARLVLAGHTHGGQIRIPWLYRWAIPSAHGFDRGEQSITGVDGQLRVFTTVGVGEVGLPMRLFNPPTIDVLHLRH